MGRLSRLGTEPLKRSIVYVLAPSAKVSRKPSLFNGLMLDIIYIRTGYRRLWLVVIAHAMKKKRLIIYGVLAALVVAYIVCIIPNFRHRAEWERTVSALQGLSHERVERAVQTFARDRKTTGRAVPLRELVSGGYLRAEDIRGLEGRDVTVSLSADETTPQLVWIRVLASDGSDIVVLADGSIQKVARR
jgi:hypothetical protein